MITRKAFVVGSAGVVAAAAAPSASAAPAAGPARQNLSSKAMPFKRPPFQGRVIGPKGPMAGVVVTNGRDCVKTDKDGNYVLPEYPEARFLSVSIPSGYACEDWYRDCWQFFGTSNFFLQACDRTAADKPCRFIHVSDSEIGVTRGQTWISDLKALADREDCALVIHTGDICGRNGLVAHMQLMNDMTMGRKVVYAAGNHDLVSSYPWGEAAFEGLYGPCWHSFDACGVHFVVTPMVAGSDRPVGYTNDQVADWMRADLALVDPKTPVVVVNHFLCSHMKPALSGRVYGAARPLDLRKACNFRAYLYGHTHTHWFTRRDGVAFINASNPNFGGIDHSPACARVITVPKEGDVTAKTFYGDFAPHKAARADAAWETKLAAGVLFGGLVDGGDRLFCATADDDGLGTGAVCALEKATGKVLWKQAVGNTIKGRLARAAGNVIGADVDGVVYAFDERDGRPVWTRRLTDDPAALLMEMATGVAASPDGMRVAVGDGKLAAVLDAATGTVVWKDGGYRAGESMALTPAFADGFIVRMTNWGPIVCNDAATGKLVWSKPGMNFPGAMPLVVGDRVLCAVGSRVDEIDLKTGTVLRTAESGKGEAFGCPGDLVETPLYYLKGTKNTGLVALDKKTLARVWSGSCGPSLTGSSAYRVRGTQCIPTTPVLLPDGTRVCAAGADGAIHFWDHATGRHLKAISTGAPYVGSVLVSGSRLFAADLDGFVRAWDILV